MGVNLFRDLGYDESSPEVSAARERALQREAARRSLAAASTPSQLLSIVKPVLYSISSAERTMTTGAASDFSEDTFSRQQISA